MLFWVVHSSPWIRFSRILPWPVRFIGSVWLKDANMDADDFVKVNAIWSLQDLCKALNFNYMTVHEKMRVESETVVCNLQTSVSYQQFDFNNIQFWSSFLKRGHLLTGLSVDAVLSSHNPSNQCVSLFKQTVTKLEKIFILWPSTSFVKFHLELGVSHSYCFCLPLEIIGLALLFFEDQHARRISFTRLFRKLLYVSN